jgi:hypothetical protein
MLLSLPGDTLASEPLGLYQAMAFTTGAGEEAEKIGFAAALAEVLAKVSGDWRLIDDPRVAALGAQARGYVEDFSFRDRMEGIPIHDEQGSRDRPHDLTVTFDAEKIDTALAELGEKPWPEPRPRIVPVVSVTFGDVFVLAEDGARGSDMRTALAVAASRTGLDVVLPTSEQLAPFTFSFGRLPDADRAYIAALAEVAGGDVGLAGKLAWSEESLGWTAEWSFDFGGKTHRWGIEGVSFDAAFRSALRGAAEVMSNNGEPERGD